MKTKKFKVTIQELKKDNTPKIRGIHDEYIFENVIKLKLKLDPVLDLEQKSANELALECIHLLGNSNDGFDVMVNDEGIWVKIE